MSMAYLPKYVHRCVVQTGPAAGNKIATEVDALDIEHESVCEHCGEVMAPRGRVLAYLYGELTKVYDL